MKPTKNLVLPDYVQYTYQGYKTSIVVLVDGQWYFNWLYITRQSNDGLEWGSHVSCSFIYIVRNVPISMEIAMV